MSGSPRYVMGNCNCWQPNKEATVAICRVRTATGTNPLLWIFMCNPDMFAKLLRRSIMDVRFCGWAGVNMIVSSVRSEL
jgi:hypothetical protein